MHYINVYVNVNITVMEHYKIVMQFSVTESKNIDVLLSRTVTSVEAVNFELMMRIQCSIFTVHC